MSDWKPCPTCGDELLKKDINEFGRTRLACLECGTGGDAEFWNDRPIEDALRERAERAEAMVEKLIERGLKLAFSTTYQTKEQSDWLALVTEWKAREK